MAQPYLGQILIVPYNFAPRGYAFCNGQILSIAQNTALFSLMGTFYGGNGTTTFALPNLQGMAPVHQGQGAGLSPYQIGETAGSQTVTLLQNQLPVHGHTPQCASAASNPGQQSPAGNVWSPAPGRTPPSMYSSNTPATNMNPGAVAAAGGSGPHNNLSPFLVMNFVIALQGIFPSRN
jgi:microcystin-dependent protein